jgi:hypothetical protein
MPNYSLQINSRFRPFSFQEMVAPWQLYGQAYKELADSYTSLGVQAGDVASMLNKELDKEAYNQYENYMQGIRDNANILASEGLNPTLRNNVYNLTNRYAQEIRPIQKAAERRQLLAEEQRKLGPGYAFEYDASTTGLDKFMNNPTFTPKQINLADVRQRSAAEFGTLAKQLRSFKENPNMYRKGFDSTVLAEYGYSPEDAARVAESIRRGEVSPEDAAASAIYNSIYGSTGVDSWSNNLNVGQQAVRNAIAEGVVGAIGQMTPQIVTDDLARENYKYGQQLNLLKEKAKYLKPSKGSGDDTHQEKRSILRPLPSVVNQSKEQKTLKNKIDRYNELLAKIDKNPSILEAKGDTQNVTYSGPYAPGGMGPNLSYYKDPNYAIRKEFEDLTNELVGIANKSYPGANIKANYRVESIPQTAKMPYSNASIPYSSKKFVYESNLGNYLNDLAEISQGYEFNIDPEAMENIMDGFENRPNYRSYILDDKGKQINKSDVEAIEKKGWKSVRPYITNGKIKFTFGEKEYTMKPEALGDITAAHWNGNESIGPGLNYLWENQEYDTYRKYLEAWAQELYLDNNTKPIGQTHTGKVDVYQFDPTELLDEE